MPAFLCVQCDHPFWQHNPCGCSRSANNGTWLPCECTNTAVEQETLMRGLHGMTFDFIYWEYDVHPALESL